MLLRLKQTRGPNTYTIDCGGGNIRAMIVNGCANAYSINTADICPDTGRGRLSYERAEYLFKQATRPLDPSGAGYTLHQLSHSHR